MADNRLNDVEEFSDAGSTYNADDNHDDESLFDVDSPSDGYMERREHPRTTYVTNPNTSANSDEDKAREAQRQQQGPSNAPQERPTSHHSQPRSRWADESTPLLDAGPVQPPPDYAAATADRRNGREREGSYGSVSPNSFSSDHPLVRNGLLGREGVFGSRDRPQSMRDASRSPSQGREAGLRGGGGEEETTTQVGDEERGFSRRKFDHDWNGRRRWTRHFNKKRILRWLVVVGGFLLILLLVGALQPLQGNGSDPSGGNGRNSPEKTPSKPDKDQPEKDHTPIFMPPHVGTTQCPFHSFTTPESFPFTDPGRLTFIESLQGTESRLFNDRVSGAIKISVAPEDQTEDIVVWVSAAASGPWTVGKSRMVEGEDFFELLFPEVTGKVARGPDGGWVAEDQSCLDISVGLLVRPGTVLENLKVSTLNFDVEVANGVFLGREGDDKTRDGLTVSNATIIDAVRGSVEAHYIESRETRIRTTSSSIGGTYALRDLLSVKSTSGQIDIDVDPKDDADPKQPKPADFTASSNSGSITVNLPTTGADIPIRDYRTHVETKSSSISGSYIFTSTGTFLSKSGALHLDVLPVALDTTASAASLRSESLSGKTRLRLLSPLDDYRNPQKHDPSWKHLKSTHRTTSGSLCLQYPDEWEGVVDGQSVSGNIELRGSDIDVLMDENIGNGLARKMLRHVVARRGFGDRKMDFKTTSGDVDVLIGSE